MVEEAGLGRLGVGVRVHVGAAVGNLLEPEPAGELEARSSSGGVFVFGTATTS